jgi:flagellar hook-associated protein 2
VQGVAARLAAVADGATDAESGSLTLAAQGRSNLVRDLNARIDEWDTRLAVRKSALVRQFSAMETALSSLKSQSSWLAGQIAGLPTISSS